LLAVVLAAGSTAALAACSASHPAAGQSSQPPLGFRTAPAFLPTTTEPVDRVVTATPDRPQLAVQGIAVEVDLPSGHVLATVTGPRVPPFVTPPPPQVTATFDIALTDVAGSIPVRLTDFSITDQLGRTFRPSLVVHERAPARRISTGRSENFQVTAVLPTGAGRLHWSPSGDAPVVSWDFIVEND
jgi:hypothetical protein